MYAIQHICVQQLDSSEHVGLHAVPIHVFGGLVAEGFVPLFALVQCVLG